MTESEFYRQCTLTKGNSKTVAWIEERGAKVGQQVQLVDDGNESIEWWDVVEVGTTRLHKSWVKKHERNYLKQRQMSDI